MIALALDHGPQRNDLKRWTLAALVMLALHAGLLATIILWRASIQSQALSGPAILVDLPPTSASPDIQRQDLAPGPTMQQADAPAQAAVARPVVEAIAPTPPQHDPTVVVPLEQQTEPSPTSKPKSEHAVKKPSEHPPAPRTSATPKAERQAAISHADTNRSAAAATANYNGLLIARLQRFKPDPANGERGTAVLSFKISRSGQVLSSHIGHSSGHAALDEETLALLHRAQPLPPFPAEMWEKWKTYSVPVCFGPPGYCRG